MEQARLVFCAGGQAAPGGRRRGAARVSLAPTRSDAPRLQEHAHHRHPRACLYDMHVEHDFILSQRDGDGRRHERVVEGLTGGLGLRHDGAGQECRQATAW